LRARRRRERARRPSPVVSPEEDNTNRAGALAAKNLFWDLEDIFPTGLGVAAIESPKALLRGLGEANALDPIAATNEGDVAVDD
jgi:hypothetical protein